MASSDVVQSPPSDTLLAALPAGDRAAYVPELDAFRALAILSVVGQHWLPEASAVNVAQGQISNGVHLFFTLSGFLITRILLQSRRAVDDRTATVGWSLRQFYARRFLRIFPVYYLVLAFGVALNFHGLRAGAAWHAAYLSNVYYLHHAWDGPASVFWTLSVEEQFYLLWPLAILLLPRRTLVPFIAAVAVAGTLVRVACILKFNAYEILTPAAANFLAVGALVATVDHPRYGSAAMARLTRLAFAAVAVGLLATDAALFARHGRHFMATAKAVHAVDQPLMSMAYAVLFAATVRGLPRAAAAVLRWPPVVYLGRISYGVYVWHLFVAAGFERATAISLTAPDGHRRLPIAAVLFALTVAVATASWFGFERPINNLKRLFPYARPARPRAGVATSAAIAPAL